MDGANSRPTQGADPAAVAGVDPNAPLVAIGALSSSLRRAAGSSKRCTLIPSPLIIPFASIPKFNFFHLFFQSIQSCLLPPCNYMHTITRICGGLSVHKNRSLDYLSGYHRLLIQ
jgi:hypothetical protein